MSNIHIENSFSYSKKYFKKYILSRNSRSDIEVRIHRSMRSLCREWAVHNFLYNLGICRSRTKDVDLQYPQKWYVSLGYFFMGWCKIFIK